MLQHGSQHAGSNGGDRKSDQQMAIVVSGFKTFVHQAPHRTEKGPAGEEPQKCGDRKESAAPNPQVPRKCCADNHRRAGPLGPVP